MNVIWHDLECGSYTADMPLWRRLADEHGDPILDVGAGTGRITLDLAARGHRITALDSDPELVGELRRRAEGMSVTAVVADARDFDLGEERFPLCIVPMQTIQLLGGSDQRERFLRCARRHLSAGGIVALAVSQSLELYEVVDGSPSPLPDICERDGIVYSSRPTAVRADRDGFVLERVREVVSAAGLRTRAEDRIRLDYVTPEQLEREGVAAGLSPAGIEIVAATTDYVGSEVVKLRA